MNIHYKIVEVWPSDHLIVARYWTDVISEKYLDSNQGTRDDGSPWRCRSDVSITLPVPTPTGGELEEIIMRNAPKFWLSSLEAVQNPDIDTEMEHIKSILGQVFTKEMSAQEETSQVLTDDEIRKLIEKFSVDKNG